MCIRDRVNPVIPEVVNQVCFKVFGDDLTVTMAAEAGQLQLNVMEPVIGESLFQSLRILGNAAKTLREKCVVGITANPEVCLAYAVSYTHLDVYKRQDRVRAILFWPNAAAFCAAICGNHEGCRGLS